MASAETTEIFDCSPEQFFSILVDYENYARFLSEVAECKVVAQKTDKKVVEFHVNVVKQFSYRLLMTEDKPRQLSWVLDSGDLFKVSNGSWTLTPTEDGKTKAVYWVEAKFKVFVPGPIAKALVTKNLPNMMSAYQKRVKELFS